VSKQHVELVQRFYQEYFASGELPWSMVDEEIELEDHDAPDQTGVYRGHAGVRRWLEDWNEAWAEWDFDVEEFIDGGDRVVVVIRMRTKGLGSGVELERQDAVVYGFRSKRIIRTDYYNSKEQALEAVGLPQQDA
jgi:ketosteroid isomerase-like protein